MEPNRTDAKRIVFEILKQAPRGLYRAQLYKAFWLAHLYYAKENRGFLTDWPVVNMPRGPGIHKGPSLIQELVDANKITQESEDDALPSYYCKPVDGASMEPLPDAAVAAVKRAVGFINGKTGNNLSHMSHKASRSWNQTECGDEMDIYSDQVPDDEYERMKSEVAEAQEAYRDLFK